MSPRLPIVMSIALLAPRAFAGAGKTALEFLSEPPGARSAAMGGAASSVADDAESSLFNPAALGDLRQRQASLGYVSLMDGMGQTSLVYGHPLAAGALAFSARSQSSGDIPSYDASDNRLGSYDASDLVLSAGYGRARGDWRWGVNLKQASQSVAGHSGKATAADLGLLYRRQAWPVAFSAAVRNLGGKISLGQGADLPRSMDLGVSGRFLHEALVAALESRQGADGETQNALGLEGWLYNVLALRVGWQSGDRAGQGLSMGLGFKLRDLQVDYSFATQGDGFAPTHRMGVSWRFGGPGERAYQEGLKLLQQDQAAEAVLKFQQALDADPKNVRAIRALREAVKRLQTEMREDDLGGKP